MEISNVIFVKFKFIKQFYNFYIFFTSLQKFTFPYNYFNFYYLFLIIECLFSMNMYFTNF